MTAERPDDWDRAIERLLTHKPPVKEVTSTPPPKDWQEWAAREADRLRKFRFN
jgi:hypothetical protein